MLRRLPALALVLLLAGLGCLHLARSQTLPLLGAGKGAVTASAAVTWNSLDKDSGCSLSGSALIATCTADVRAGVRATASASSSKKYYKVVLTTVNGLDEVIGIADASAPLSSIALGNDTHSIAATTTGQVSLNGSSLGPNDIFIVGDTLHIAVDISNNLFWVKVNALFWNTDNMADPATGVGGYDISGRAAGALFPAVMSGRFGGGGTFDVFTADFSGSGAPSGFNPW